MDNIIILLIAKSHSDSLKAQWLEKTTATPFT